MPSRICRSSVVETITSVLSRTGTFNLPMPEEFLKAMENGINPGSNPGGSINPNWNLQGTHQKGGRRI